MGAKENRWAAVARVRLVERLGGAYCRHCGTTKDLTFDCIRPPAEMGHARGVSPPDRMRYYHRQEQAGNVQVLCRGCNARKLRLPDAVARRRARRLLGMGPVMPIRKCERLKAKG